MLTKNWIIFIFWREDVVHTWCHNYLYVGKIIFFISSWWQPSAGKPCFQTSEVFWTALWASSMRLPQWQQAWWQVSCLIKNKFAIPEESRLGNKMDFLGYIPIWWSWAGCNLYFFLGQYHVFTYAEQRCTFPSISGHRPIKIPNIDQLKSPKDQLFQTPSGPWSDENTFLVVLCPTVFFFYDGADKPAIVLSPISNLGSHGLVHLDCKISVLWLK